MVCILIMSIKYSLYDCVMWWLNNKYYVQWALKINIMYSEH